MLPSFVANTWEFGQSRVSRRREIGQSRVSRRREIGQSRVSRRREIGQSRVSRRREIGAVTCLSMPLFVTHNYAIVGLVYLCVTCHDVIILCVCMCPTGRRHWATGGVLVQSRWRHQHDLRAAPEEAGGAAAAGAGASAHQAVAATLGVRWRCTRRGDVDSADDATAPKLVSETVTFVHCLFRLNSYACV